MERYNKISKEIMYTDAFVMENAEKKLKNRFIWQEKGDLSIYNFIVVKNDARFIENLEAALEQLKWSGVSMIFGITLVKNFLKIYY